MAKSRNLIAAVAGATMLIGALPAVAQAATVDTSGGGGRAVYSHPGGPAPDGGGNRFPTNDPGSIKACDRDQDGFGVVAYVWEGERLRARAVDRNGTGTCGKRKAFQADGPLRVEVCLHDKDGNKDQSGSLQKCRSESAD